MSDSPDEHPAMPRLAPPDPPLSEARPSPQPPEGSAAERRQATAPVGGSPVGGSPVGTSLVAWAALLIAIGEAGALAYLWTNPRVPPGIEERVSSAERAAHDAAARAEAANDAISSIKGQLDPLRSDVTALKQRPEIKPTPPFNPQPLQSAIDSLRSGLGGVHGQADRALAAATGAQKAAQANAGAFAGQISGLSSRIDQVSSQLGQLSTRLDQAGAEGREVATLAGSAERLARLQAASVALSFGRPVGDVPNAPPSLARFADSAPPTEASLILSFPDAAASALRASQPDTQGEGFFRRVWIRAQSAITVRDGTHVLIGDPAAGIIAAARERLAAGDLEGAVSVLGALSGPAADAMDAWRSKAASLVDARAALAQLMQHASLPSGH